MKTEKIITSGNYVAGVPASLKGCHPLVANTAAYFTNIRKELKEAARLNAQNSRRREPQLMSIPHSRTNLGRYIPDKPECLWITATLDRIDWILRFHAGLIKGLMALGYDIRHTAVDTRRWKVEVFRGPVSAEFKFIEDVQKVFQANPLYPWERYDYRSLDSYKLKMERAFHRPKEWRGSSSDLTEKLPEIVKFFDQSLTSQVEERKVREAAEAEAKRVAAERAEKSRIWFAAQERIYEGRRVRKQQIERLNAVGAAALQHAATVQALVIIEARASTSVGLPEWLAVVRDSLVDPVEALIKAISTEASGAERPLWWPEEPNEKPPEGG